MELVKLYNPEPPKGADIISNFVAKEDEKKVIDPKTKEHKVTNSKDISFPAGCERTFDKKTAEFILRIWGFVEKVGVSNEPEEELFKDELDIEVELENDINPEDEFAILQAMGYKNLKGDDRERYSELKEELDK